MRVFVCVCVCVCEEGGGGGGARGGKETEGTAVPEAWKENKGGGRDDWSAPRLLKSIHASRRGAGYTPDDIDVGGPLAHEHIVEDQLRRQSDDDGQQHTEPVARVPVYVCVCVCMYEHAYGTSSASTRLSE